MILCERRLREIQVALDSRMSNLKSLKNCPADCRRRSSFRPHRRTQEATCSTAAHPRRERQALDGRLTEFERSSPAEPWAKCSVKSVNLGELIVTHPAQGQGDLRRAHDWYEERCDGLAMNFSRPRQLFCD